MLEPLSALVVSIRNSFVQRGIRFSPRGLNKSWVFVLETRTPRVVLN